jgi:hypothetical protein
MFKSKFLMLALLFAPLAFLSGCGTGPAYGQADANSKQTIAYNPVQGTWGQVPDTTPTTTPAGSTGTNSNGTSNGVANYCTLNKCNVVLSPLPVSPANWAVHIPVPMPDPVPEIGSHVIYNNQVLKITGASATTRVPSLVVRPVATLNFAH